MIWDDVDNDPDPGSFCGRGELCKPSIAAQSRFDHVGIDHIIAVGRSGLRQIDRGQIKVADTVHRQMRQIAFCGRKIDAFTQLQAIGGGKWNHVRLIHV